MAKSYDDDDDPDFNIRKPGGGDVPNYLVQAIIVTLCCCLPFGIVAIIKASQVNTLLAKGDHEGALAASEEAKKWCWIAAILGAIGSVIYIGLQMMAGGGGRRGF